MKKSTYSSILFLLAFGFWTLQLQAQAPAEKLKAVYHLKREQVLVAAHRGDWRNAPENSLQGLKNSIEKGFDLVELDVKMTRDSQLVVMHDNTIDRSTNGKGKVSDYTLAELRKFRLKNGLGRPTAHQIPTLKEMMEVAKNKILINVDKGNPWLPQVYAVLQETGTLDQSIVNVNDNQEFGELNAQFSVPEEMNLMVVVGMKLPNALKVIESYRMHKKSIIQPVFDTDSLESLGMLPRIAARQVIWLNSLWPSLNGGHDDDRAVEQKEEGESWGWLLDKKATFIQSDRPAELLKYLKNKGLHL